MDLQRTRTLSAGTVQLSNEAPLPDKAVQPTKKAAIRWRRVATATSMVKINQEDAFLVLLNCHATDSLGGSPRNGSSLS